MERSLPNTVVKRPSGDPRSAARKPKTKSVALGQVFTPPDLARRMVEGLGLSKAAPGVTLLDPCVGPATFPAAVADLGMSHIAIRAYDVDTDMVEITKLWAAKHQVKDIAVVQSDYLNTIPAECYDFAILNPPYLRQEWIENKESYRESFRRRYGVDIPGTANLYVYFIVKTVAELSEGGRLACIVYDSWQSTRFGRWLQNYLACYCHSINVESVHGLPFENRLIDATILYLEKGNGVGAVGNQPSTEQFTDRFSELSPVNQLFSTRRGLRLKQAGFFLTDLNAVERDGATPFIKKVNLVSGFSVLEDHPEAALLVTPSRRDERTLRALQHRLSGAQLAPENNIPILTWWRERPEAWASHADGSWAPLLFNYYLRRRPRHIYNPRQERIFSDNFYGLTPRKSDVPVLAWLAALNATLTVVGVLERARNQGAGLAKLQLFEYREARVVDLEQWSLQDISKMMLFGQELACGGDPEKMIASIDELIAVVLGKPELRNESLRLTLEYADCRARRPKN